MVGRQVKAHHRPPHDVALGVSARCARERGQLAYRRADQGFEILRALDIAGDGDYARNHRLTLQHRTRQRISGGDVEYLHADFGGAPTGRRLFAREHFGQLLGAAGGIFSGHHHHFEMGTCAGSAHGLNGFGFIVLDADQHFGRAYHVLHNFRAADDLIRAFAHQEIIAGDPRFAFGTI